MSKSSKIKRKVEKMTIVNSDIDVLVDALRSLGAGALLGAAAENLKEAIRAVQMTGKTAGVTIKISVKSDPNSEGEVLVFGTTSASLPKEPVKARFYVSNELLPVRNAPNQLVMKM